MKLLRRGKDNEAADTPEEPDTTPATQGKGRPTPKRRDAQRRRGPVAPAPMTAKAAKARRKATRADAAARRQAAADSKARMADRRARMMAGEDEFLLPRDRGDVRRHVRDIVDARRNLAGMFMPLALVLILATFVVPKAQLALTTTMAALMIFMAVDSLILGRIVNKRVAQRFPNSTDRGFKLGWYAFVRAAQIRWLRAPKPQKKPGDAV